MKKHIPNMITSLSLFSGCIAAIMAFNGEYFWVVIWVIIAGIFDFCDGFVARLLKAFSPMGKELDSLSDDISFGFAPSVAVYMFLKTNLHLITSNDIVCTYLPYVAFILAIFSALRLAKFNIDERQSDSFIGLNTPANALLWVSTIYGLSKMAELSPIWIYVVLVGIPVFSLLMVSELPMFSFKIKSLKLKGNEARYFLILFAVISFYFFGLTGIAGVILIYILLSFLSNLRRKTE